MRQRLVESQGFDQFEDALHSLQATLAQGFLLGGECVACRNMPATVSSGHIHHAMKQIAQIVRQIGLIATAQA